MESRNGQNVEELERLTSGVADPDEHTRSDDEFSGDESSDEEFELLKIKGLFASLPDEIQTLRTLINAFNDEKAKLSDEKRYFYMRKLISLFPVESSHKLSMAKGLLSVVSSDEEKVERLGLKNDFENLHKQITEVQSEISEFMAECFRAEAMVVRMSIEQASVADLLKAYQQENQAKEKKPDQEETVRLSEAGAALFTRQKTDGAPVAQDEKSDTYQLGK